MPKAATAETEKLPARPYTDFPKLMKVGFGSMVKRYADATKLEAVAKATKNLLKDPMKDAMATLPKHQDSVTVGDYRATYCRGETSRTISRDQVVKNCLRMGIDPAEVLADAEKGGEEYFYVLVTPPRDKEPK